MERAGNGIAIAEAQDAASGTGAVLLAQLRALGPGEALALPSLGCEVAVDAFYLRVFEGLGEV